MANHEEDSRPEKTDSASDDGYFPQGPFEALMAANSMLNGVCEGWQEWGAVRKRPLSPQKYAGYVFDRCMVRLWSRRLGEDDLLARMAGQADLPDEVRRQFEAELARSQALLDETLRELLWHVRPSDPFTPFVRRRPSLEAALRRIDTEALYRQVKPEGPLSRLLREHNEMMAEQTRAGGIIACRD